MKEIEDLNPIKRKITKSKNYIRMKISLSNSDRVSKNTLKDQLNILKEQLIKNGVMISFFINYDICDIYFKKLNEKTETSRYIYHSSSPENRESILKHGLIPKSSDESKEWFFSHEYAYPKAIFATKVNNTGIINPWGNVGYDIWRIDTNILKNEWFVDLNYTGEKEINHIMTFEPIASKYLTLVKKGILK